MLGHVAGSAGNALPGGGASVSPLISQVLVTQDGTVVSAPAGTTHAFIEVQAKGGTVSGPAAPSAGGAASDAIVVAAAGDSFQFALPFSTFSNADEASASRAGTKLISAMSPPSYSPGSSNTGAVQPGPSGKYPGGVGKNVDTDGGKPAEAATDRGGLGGGRLAGRPGSKNFADRDAPGHGSGRYGSNELSNAFGGKPVGCVTFFRNYDAALAFAKACYGGVWNP